MPERNKFRLYWASQPPPADLTEDRLNRLIPVDFTTEQDAIYAAALVLRANDFVWCIQRPDRTVLGAAEIEKACADLLALFKSARRSKDAKN